MTEGEGLKKLSSNWKGISRVGRVFVIKGRVGIGTLGVLDGMTQFGYRAQFIVPPFEMIPTYRYEAPRPL